jgi:exonuclease 3'-5' domain-containing protein 1
VILFLNVFCQDPNFWTYRPLSEQMIHSAADDVRFLLYIYHQMMAKLNERSLWHLAVRGALYCRCFCVNSNDYADWPSLPPIPGLQNLSDSIMYKLYFLVFIL